MENIQIKINEIIEKNKKEIEKNNNLILKLKEQEEKNLKIIENAIGTNNAKEYAKVTTENNLIKEQINFYKNKILSLENERLINKEEYNSTKSQIELNFKDNQEKYKSSIVEKLNDILNIIDKANGDFVYSNELLNKLQNDLYRRDKNYKVGDSVKVPDKIKEGYIDTFIYGDIEKMFKMLDINIDLNKKDTKHWGL